MAFDRELAACTDPWVPSFRVSLRAAVPTLRRRPRASKAGPVRSLRLPSPLDRWFEERFASWPGPLSTLLVSLVHGGLRLREGYMAIHRRTLEALVMDGRQVELQAYVHALHDTFGAQYVDHLERWLQADGVKAIHEVFDDRTAG
jgi:hypothetical protein